MSAPISAEVRAHATRTHRRRMTRAARGWLAALIVGVLAWVGLIALAAWALGLAP